MEKNYRIQNEYAGQIVEYVSHLMEQWAPYVQTRELLWEILAGYPPKDMSAEDLQTLLMDYEMALILAAYLLGMSADPLSASKESQSERILEMLDCFSPLTRADRKK